MAFVAKIPSNHLNHVAARDSFKIFDLINRRFRLPAVTNARIASFHGLAGRSYASRPRPFTSQNRALITSGIGIGRRCGGLPSAARRRDVPAPAAMR